MKTTIKYGMAWGFAVAVGSAMLTSCNTNSVKNKLYDFQTLIAQQRDSINNNLVSGIKRSDSLIEVKEMELLKDTINMSLEMRDSFYLAVNAWNQYKLEYARTAQERTKIDEMDTVRKALALPEVRNDFSNLTVDKMPQQYQHFLSVVKANKDGYSKQQWLVVNTSWRSLNGRKRQLKNDVSEKTENEIARLQLEYLSIKAANRPMAENAE